MKKITLRAARVNAGLKQEEAAKKIGVNLRTIQKWENYESFPSVKRVPAIEETYGVTYDAINFLP